MAPEFSEWLGSLTFAASSTVALSASPAARHPPRQEAAARSDVSWAGEGEAGARWEVKTPTRDTELSGPQGGAQGWGVTRWGGGGIAQEVGSRGFLRSLRWNTRKGVGRTGNRTEGCPGARSTEARGAAAGGPQTRFSAAGWHRPGPSCSGLWGGHAGGRRRSTSESGFLFWQLPLLVLPAATP